MEKENRNGELRPYSFASLGFPSFAKKLHIVCLPYSTVTGNRVVGRRVTLERKSTHSALSERVSVLFAALLLPDKKDIISPGRLK